MQSRSMWHSEPKMQDVVKYKPNTFKQYLPSNTIPRNVWEDVTKVYVYSYILSDSQVALKPLRAHIFG